MPDSSVPANRAGRKPGAKNRYSSATIGRDILEHVHTYLYVVGPQKYFRDLHKKQPAVFAQFVLAAMKNAEPNETPAITFQIVQLTANGASAVPGVLNSPIAANIAPQRGHLQLVQQIDGDEAEQ